MGNGLRLPDFIVIGAMKSGTSSLYQWLAEQPELTLPAVKEPHFFSREPAWQRGLEWYAGLFAGAAEGQLVGEASTTYTNPDASARAAERMAEVVPDARLVYLLRHPVERLRSHYRHSLLKDGETRPLLDALSAPDNPYLRRSMYHHTLEPYLQRFPRHQLCVVRFEDLVSEPAPAWTSVLGHLGLPDRPRPTSSHNVSADTAHFSPPLARLRRTRWYQELLRLPRPVRKVGRALLGQDGPKHAARLETSNDPVPEELVAPIWADIERLEAWLGVDEPLWEREAPLRA